MILVAMIVFLTVWYMQVIREKGAFEKLVLEQHSENLLLFGTRFATASALLWPVPLFSCVPYLHLSPLRTDFHVLAMTHCL